MITIRRYTSIDKPLWDGFVALSKNATFLHYRDYMDYHSDRFHDFSLMAFDGGRLLALLPANLSGDTLYSHQGLTFGGWLMPLKHFNANTMTELLDWEISRMIGYYVNYLYLQEHQFSFASPKEIDEYLTYPSVKEKLVSLFMSAKTSPELKVSMYLKNYYADRRVKRNVVFHSF